LVSEKIEQSYVNIVLSLSAEGDQKKSKEDTLQWKQIRPNQQNWPDFEEEMKTKRSRRAENR